jgi:hypothetical protein
VTPDLVTCTGASDPVDFIVRKKQPKSALQGGTKMAKLPYVDLAAAPDAVRVTLERLPVRLNIFRMMAHAQTNLRPLLRLGTSILSEQRLDGKLRELAILRVAQLSPARYEWVQHVPIARAFGASPVQIEALLRRRRAPGPALHHGVDRRRAPVRPGLRGSGECLHAAGDRRADPRNRLLHDDGAVDGNDGDRSRTGRRHEAHRRHAPAWRQMIAAAAPVGRSQGLRLGFTPGS